MKKLPTIPFCNLILAAALIVTLAGCPESVPPAAPGAGPSPQPGTTSNEGVVLPLEPVGEEKPAEEKKDEAPAEGTFLAPADVFGKVAAEAVPMPPVEDLVGQIDEYIEKIGKTLDDLDGTINYKNDGDFVVRDANGLALVALSVGMNPNDSKYKKAAPAIIKAAMDLTKIEKYDEAKKSYEVLKAALTGEGDPASLQWTKVAELPPVMKAVPNLSSTITRWTNTERKLKTQLKKPERLLGATAALAAMTQGSIANVKDTTKPDEAALWKKECEQFRDAAIKTNAAVHDYADGKVDYKTYWDTFKKMTETCDDCHKVFYPSAVGQAE